MSFWTPVENPGTRPLRSRDFDIGCALLGALGRSGAIPSPRPRAPTQAADAIRGVSGTAREALAKTRRLHGILRAEGGQELRQPLPACPTSRACSPGSGRPGCRSGTNAAVSRGHAAGVQLVIFRLVQEALTNTMKHAGPGASAAVRLRLAPGEVRVDIRVDIAAMIDCLLCCGLPVGRHCIAAQQIMTRVPLAGWAGHCGSGRRSCRRRVPGGIPLP